MMKQVQAYLLMLTAVVLTVVGCDKQLPKTVATTGIAPTVTLSPQTLVLSAGTATNNVLNISWTKADFGFKAAISYSVELVNSLNTFSNAVTVSTGSKMEHSYLG